MKVLLVEDDISLNNTICKILDNLNINYNTFYSGKDLKDDFIKYDLAIIDINLPDINGLDLTKKIKSSNKNLPILIISSYNDLDIIKSAYNLGCEDYLKKPFFIEELEYKIKKYIKNQIKLDKNLIYDFDKKVLIKNNQLVELTKKEYLLLELFLNNLDKSLSIEQIKNTLYNEFVNDNTIRVLVSRLKNKLDKKFIKNSPTIGYRLCLD